MLCINCKTELSFQFKHAFVKNECPACGKSIMDEESLALIEDIKSFLLTEATIREETAHKFAMSLVAKYNISTRGELQRIQKPDVKVEAKEEPMKMAIPDPFLQQRKILESNLVTASELNGISDEERDRIAEEAIRKKYAMVDKGQGILLGEDDFELQEELVVPDANKATPLFSDEINLDVLEQSRRARLVAQQNAIANGGLTKYGKPASFRRG